MDIEDLFKGTEAFRTDVSDMTYDEAHRAIKRGDLECLRYELERGLDPNLANRVSSTLLMLAAMNGNTSIGRLLIDKGADPNVRTKHGQSALSLAVMTGHPSFVKLLLTSGASQDWDLNGDSSESFLDWSEKYCAVSTEQMKHIRALFDEERNLRAKALL